MMTIGTRRVPCGDGSFDYVGVLRADRQVIAECGHTHRNRNHSTKTSGESATDCIRGALRAAVRPAAREYAAKEIGTRWLRLNSGTGFAVPADTVAAAKQDCANNVAAFEALCDHIAAELAARHLTVQISQYSGALSVVAA